VRGVTVFGRKEGFTTSGLQDKIEPSAKPRNSFPSLMGVRANFEGCSQTLGPPAGLDGLAAGPAPHDPVGSLWSGAAKVDCDVSALVWIGCVDDNQLSSAEDPWSPTTRHSMENALFEGSRCPGAIRKLRAERHWRVMAAIV